MSNQLLSVCTIMFLCQHLGVAPEEGAYAPRFAILVLVEIVGGTDIWDLTFHICGTLWYYDQWMVLRLLYNWVDRLNYVRIHTLHANRHTACWSGTLCAQQERWLYNTSTAATTVNSGIVNEKPLCCVAATCVANCLPQHWLWQHFNEVSRS